MTKQFDKGAEEQYRKWIETNQGYVWIKGHGKVHKTSCRFGERPGTKGGETRERIWGATKEELLHWLQEHGKTVTAECKTCMGDEVGDDTGDDGGDNGQGPEKVPAMKDLLEQFGQVILYGPPGTGKTREAKRAALAILSGSDPLESATSAQIEEQLRPFREDNRFELVVFHPAYEYEQFVGGIEPLVREDKLVFQVKAGIFLRLCRRAQKVLRVSRGASH